jgi:hypothetical protein
VSQLANARHTCEVFGARSELVSREEVRHEIAHAEIPGADIDVSFKLSLLLFGISTNTYMRLSGQPFQIGFLVGEARQAATVLT